APRSRSDRSSRARGHQRGGLRRRAASDCCRSRRHQRAHVGGDRGSHTVACDGAREEHRAPAWRGGIDRGHTVLLEVSESELTWPIEEPLGEARAQQTSPLAGLDAEDREQDHEHALAGADAARIVFLAGAALALWFGFGAPIAGLSVVGIAGILIGGWPIFKEAWEN